MYSQSNRLFSQEGEVSQITSSLDDPQTSNQDDATSTHREINEEDHCSNDYNFQADLPLSTRADAICEQNRQVRGYLEKNLKQIEKKRIKFSNKISEIEKEINMYMEIHKRQSQQSLDLQMNIEEMAEKYQSELNQRENLKERLKHTQIFVDYFAQHYSEIPKVAMDLEKSKHDLSIAFEKLSNDFKAKILEKHKLKESYFAEMDEKTCKAQETKGCIMKQRETAVNLIKTFDAENTKNLKDQKSVQEKITVLVNKRTKMNDSYIKLVNQNKLMKEFVVNLHQEMDELNSTSALGIQNLKLQINNEENSNSNLQKKYEENDNLINCTSMKEKELINLYNQLSGAIEETTNRQEDKLKKIDEYKDKKSIVFNEIKKLEEEIKEYENSPNLNEFLKNEIKRLEEYNTAKEIIFLEKQHSVKKLGEEELQLKKVYDDNVCVIQKINTELEKSTYNLNVLNTKLEEDAIKNLTERNAKILKNKSLEQLNVDSISKVNKLTHDLDEAQNLNNKLKTVKMKICKLIEQNSERKLEAEEKLKIIISEEEEKCKAFDNNIELKNQTLDEIEELIIEARPYQQELVKLLTRKEALNHDIQQQRENYCKERELEERSFNSKLKEINGQIEKYTTIMEGIIKDEVEATEKLKQEINKLDVVRMNHETDLENLFQQITSLKNEEQVKRNRVVKLEKRLKTINNEIKVTRQDLNDAITGNVKKHVKGKYSAELIPPFATSVSKSAHQNLHQEPPEKKMTMASNYYDNKNMNQTKTKPEPFLPEDEYDFSDI